MASNCLSSASLREPMIRSSVQVVCSGINTRENGGNQKSDKGFEVFAMSNGSLIPLKVPERDTGCLVALSARIFRSRDIDLMDFCILLVDGCFWVLLT